jgi:hypothetical protein
MTRQRWWPFFCEENVAWLCRDAPWPMWALVVGNPARTVAVWGSTASDRSDRLVIWDYHVVAVAVVDDTAFVLDHSCATSTVLSLSDWLQTSFRDSVAEPYRPRFRRYAAGAYLQALCSDRRHMRDEDGACLQPFPPWPGPREEEGSTVMALTTFYDDADEEEGIDDDDIDGVCAFFGVPSVILHPLSLD